MSYVEILFLPQSFSELPEYGRLLFNSESGVGLAAVLCDVPEEARSFLQSFLQLEPGRRLSAAKALSDPFFSSNPLPEPMIKKRREGPVVIMREKEV